MVYMHLDKLSSLDLVRFGAHDISHHISGELQFYLVQF